MSESDVNMSENEQLTHAVADLSFSEGGAAEIEPTDEASSEDESWIDSSGEENTLSDEEKASRKQDASHIRNRLKQILVPRADSTIKEWPWDQDTRAEVKECLRELDFHMPATVVRETGILELLQRITSSYPGVRDDILVLISIHEWALEQNIRTAELKERIRKYRDDVRGHQEEWAQMTAEIERRAGMPNTTHMDWIRLSRTMYEMREEEGRFKRFFQEARLRERAELEAIMTREQVDEYYGWVDQQEA